IRAAIVEVGLRSPKSSLSSFHVAGRPWSRSLVGISSAPPPAHATRKCMGKPNRRSVDRRRSGGDDGLPHSSRWTAPRGGVCSVAAGCFAGVCLSRPPFAAGSPHERPPCLERVRGRFPPSANCWRRRFLHSCPCTHVPPALADLRAAGSSGFLAWLATLRAARCSPASRREGNFVVHRRSGSGLASATRSSRVSFRRIQDFYGGLGCDEHGSIAARSISACTHFPA